MKNKKLRFLGVTTLVLAAVLSGCGGSAAEPVQEIVENEPFVPEVVGTYEAEDGILTGNVKAVASPTKTGYTGTGYVDGFENEADTCTFQIEIEKEGFYDLLLHNASNGGNKENDCFVDGQSAGSFKTSDTGFADSLVERVYLTAGQHSVEIRKSWGWISLDHLKVQTAEPIDESIYQVEPVLVNPNANDKTKRVFQYLCDIYGKNILSGQFCDNGMVGKEFQVIKRATDKTPAVLGLDLIEASPSRVENGSKSVAADRAIDFSEAGGLVHMTWHWNAPSKYISGTWYSAFYKEHTNIDLEKIMNGEDQEGYDLLVSDIDAIAKELQKMEDANVTVLWRPLHEASGGWFWWGAKGPEAYKKLYILLYDKLTNEYGLDNLIWVWNGQHADWYPGDEYVDIVGEDLYPGERVYSSQVNKYLEATKYCEQTKLVYLTENGCVFDPELAVRDGAMWGMWCTWSGDFVAKNTAVFQLSEQYTEKSMLQKAYNHEAVITLDELPDFTTYESNK